MIREWAEVLRRWMIWRGCIDKELSWWCVRWWDEIQMVHWSMRNDSRVADELYIKRVLLALEDFLFFSLYSVSCFAKQVTTLNHLRLLFWHDSLDTNFERHPPCLRYHIWVTNITYARPRPLHSLCSSNPQTVLAIPSLHCLSGLAAWWIASVAFGFS